VRKVTSEVSISRRRRSPSARSALPLKASLTQFKNPRLLCDELEPEAAVSAWIEAESAQKEASSAQEQVASQAEEVQQQRLELGQVIRERDQPRSHAAEAVSRAHVLGGQLAEATERPAEVSARAGTLEETLAAMAQARC
jgi:phosphoglycolate phosphatase-like HAD superfamily hydrolase